MTTVDSQTPEISLRDITRRFGGVHALSGVDLDLRLGEVVALVGENGAGKSTLVKILTGNLEPNEGRILIQGEQRRIANPRAARELGIAATFQEPAVFPDLSVAENLFVGRLPTRARAVDRRTMYREAEAVFGQLGVDVDPRATIAQLGVADRQLVEIAKALTVKARILILDEPTAVLSGPEIENLFRIVKAMRADGMGLLFISHKMDEVTELADRVVVLRDGRNVGEHEKGEIVLDTVLREMVGRPISNAFPDRPEGPDRSGAPILEVKGLSRGGEFDDVSFTLHRGEVLGMSGLVGAGRTEVAQVLFGVNPADSGEVTFNGRPFRPRSPRHAIRAGLVYLPENRVINGLVHTMRVPDNITMTIWDQFRRWGVLFSGRQMRTRAEQLRLPVGLDAKHVGKFVNTLSGGNQQKVVLGKSLGAQPSVLILDEPTHGIDVGTKFEILRIVADLARSGVAVVLISSELEEVIALSTRLIVMHRGTIAGEFTAPFDREQVIQSGFGLSEERAAR